MFTSKLTSHKVAPEEGKCGRFSFNYTILTFNYDDDINHKYPQEDTSVHFTSFDYLYDLILKA